MYKHSKAQILRTASELFSVRGYHGTCMRELASAVGISQSGIYTYVRSKQELLQGVAYMAIDMFLHRAMSLTEDIAAEERLTLLAQGHLDVMTREWPYMTVLFHQARFLNPLSLLQVQQRYTFYESHFYAAIEAGMALSLFQVADVHVAGRFVLSALNWTYLWPRPSEMYQRQAIDQYVQIILRALKDGQLSGPCL
jgi:AcrR family transcriptional regulator